MPLVGHAIKMPRALNRAEAVIGREALDALDDMQEIMIRGVQNQIIVEDAVASEGFLKSITSERFLQRSALMLTIFSKDNPKKVHVLEHGLEPGEMKPGRAGVKPIVAWARLKNIVPREGTSERAYESLAWAIMWHQYQYGVEGREIFRKSRARYAFRVVQRARQLGRRVARELSSRKRRGQ